MKRSTLLNGEASAGTIISRSKQSSHSDLKMSQNFFKTLKSIGYPDIKNFVASDFDTICSDPDLQEFINSFCTLNEDNVLYTKSEIEICKKITDSHPIDYENLTKNREISEEEYMNETRNEEEEYLTERLAQLERRCKLLQDQKELLKEHMISLANEKTECEIINRNLKKLCDEYRINKLPQAELKLTSTIKSILELIIKLRDVANASSDKSYILPNLELKDIEEYFEEEEKIINYVQSYIKNNFQFEDERMLSLNIPGLSNDEIIKVLHILNKSLKKSKVLEMKSTCEYKRRQGSLKFIKEYKADNYAYISEMSTAQLSIKLQEELLINEKLSKKEDLLMTYFSNAVEELLEAQCCKIAIARSNEVLRHYEHNLEKLSLPLTHLLNQRARLEFLILYMKMNKNNFKEIKIVTQEALTFIESEQKACFERKQQFEDPENAVIADEKYLTQNSVLLSIYKIINNIEDQNMTDITVSDVVIAIEQLIKKKERTKAEKENKHNITKSMQKYYSKMENYFVEGKQFSEFQSLEKQFSIMLNHIDTLLTEAHDVLRECEVDWKEKNKLLDKKKNLMFGRSLFILALLDEDTFRDFIEMIKKHRKYSKST